MTFLKTWEFEPLLDVFELGLSPQYHRDIQDLRAQDCPFPLGEKVLQDLFRDKFDITHSTRKEFYLLICAYLFMLSREKATRSLFEKHNFPTGHGDSDDQFL